MQLPRDQLKGYVDYGHVKTPAYSNSSAAQPGHEHLPRFQQDASGVMHQCVALARRAIWDNKALLLPDIAVASQMLFLPHLFELVDADADGAESRIEPIDNGGVQQNYGATSEIKNDNIDENYYSNNDADQQQLLQQQRTRALTTAVRKVPISHLCQTNGKSRTMPRPGDLIIHASHAANPPGHVAVCVAASSCGSSYSSDSASGVCGFICVVDQNRRNHAFDDHQQRFPVKQTSDGCFAIVDPEEPVLGWISLSQLPDRPLPAAAAAANGRSPTIAPRWLGEAACLSVRPWPAKEIAAHCQYTDTEREAAANLAFKTFHPSPAMIPVAALNLFMIWPLLTPLRIWLAM